MSYISLVYIVYTGVANYDLFCGVANMDYILLHPGRILMVSPQQGLSKMAPLASILKESKIMGAPARIKNRMKKLLKNLWMVK